MWAYKRKCGNNPQQPLNTQNMEGNVQEERVIAALELLLTEKSPTEKLC